MGERPVPPDVEEGTRRWMWSGLILMALFIAAFPAYRLYEPNRRAEARETQAEFLAQQGGELFAGDCSGCHGPQGHGGLGPALGSSDFLAMVTDAQISQLISVGVPGTAMVAYSIDYGGPLTSTEIESITAYLRSLEPDAMPNPDWQKPLAAEDLSGHDLFNLACSRCHGVDRKGIQGVAPDISATSSAMDESDEWIARRIREGRNEMPRFGGVLTADQIALVIGYLRGAG